MKVNVRKTISFWLIIAVMVNLLMPINTAFVSGEEADELTDVGIWGTITTDAVSSWENLSGVISPSFEPTSSNQGAGHGWGNWSKEPGTEHWIQLDWKTEITTSSFDVYWYDDNGGTRIPAAIRFQYKDASGNWQDANMISNYNDVIKLNTYNNIKISEITTSSIRMNLTVHVDGNANGVYRWKVWVKDVPPNLPVATPTPEPTDADISLPDAAIYAEPTSDYTSAWENINGINNPNFNPTSSSMGQTGLGWGDWSQTSGSEHWLQYTWAQPLDLHAFQVYWYGDNGGIQVPSNVRFEYLDANGKWQKATMTSQVANITKEGRYNQILIDKVNTTAIRMYMTVASSAQGVGVYRWKVHSDIPESFEVASILSQIEIPEVHDSTISKTVCDQLTLPSSASGGNVSITWKSSNTNVIADNGKITAPAKDTKVTLTATAKKGDIILTRDIEITVLETGKTRFNITVDKEKKGVDISQEMFGLFYEDINSAGDGGIATELVKNNSFENYDNVNSATAPETKGDQTTWKRHWTTSNSNGFTIENTDGLNENNKNYAKITGNMTLKNGGFAVKSSVNAASIPIKKDATFDFSVFAKAAAGYAGTLKVKVVNASNQDITDEKTLNLVKDGTWKKVKTQLTGTATQPGTIVLTFENASGSDAIYIDMVSLHPTDTFGYGNKNYAYGAGLRKDLIEKLKAMKPSFIRFPGGCIVEGSYGTDSYYNWENSIGAPEERKATGSYWKNNSNYGNTNGYGYMMSYEFGYHEILTLCEDLGAQAFPILSAGIYCQFRTVANPATGSALDAFAAHATNLIDYCWGDPLSSNVTQAKWAAKRVTNGHEKPFDLNYIGIGNENWGSTYYSNFEYIKKIIDAYVEKNYPGRKITLISSTGPYYPGSQNTEAWRWINSNLPGQTLVDEHYYINYANDSNNTLLSGDYVYDSYKRLNEGGSNVFVGEYAGHVNSTTENVLDTAISEAAYMTGFERNGDIVRHASYAPMLEKEGCRDWDYNMIKFDSYNSYGTPSYYVQLMFANNYGKTIVNTKLGKYNSQTSGYVEYNGHQNEVYQVSSMDDEYIYLKLVNHDSYAKDITVNYPGIADGTKVEKIVLSGNAMDKNTMTNPEQVSPKTSETQIKDEKLQYVIPGMSFTILKVSYNAKDDPVPTASPEPTATPAPTASPEPTNTPEPVETPEPTGTPESTNSPASTATPAPTGTPIPTSTQVPSASPQPTAITAVQAEPVGTKLEDKKTKLIYKVTKSSGTTGEVAVIGGRNKNTKKIFIRGFVKLKGVQYKVTSIGAKAFAGYKKLAKVVIISKSLKKVGKKAFSGINKKAIIKVPKKKLKDYKKILKKSGIRSSIKIK